MTEENVSVFDGEFYRELSSFTQVEEALRTIKRDESLQRILYQYAKDYADASCWRNEIPSLPRQLSLYTKKHTFLGKRVEQVLKDTLFILLSDEDKPPMPFVFGQRERFYTNPQGGDRPGWVSGWETRWYFYRIEERDNGFYLAEQRKDSYSFEGAPRFRGIYDGLRISRVAPLKHLKKWKMMSNLKRALRKL